MASEGADLGPKKVAVALRAARRARLLDDDSTADRFESKPRPLFGAALRKTMSIV